MDYKFEMKTNIEIYCKSNCLYCDKAKYLFNEHDASYAEHNAEMPLVIDELIERNPHARTMPQIFINNELISGYDDLVFWLIF